MEGGKSSGTVITGYQLSRKVREGQVGGEGGRVALYIKEGIDSHKLNHWGQNFQTPQELELENEVSEVAKKVSVEVTGDQLPTHGLGKRMFQS